MLTHCLRQGFDAEVKFRDFTVHLFTSMEMAEAEWSANSPMDEYWQPDYHKALEGAAPGGLKPLYVTFWKGDEWAGLAYFQYKKIDLSEALKSGDRESATSAILRKLILSWLNMHTLVLGNMLLTGKYGCHFSPDIDLEQRPELVLWLTEWVSNWLKGNKINIGPVLIKDFNFGQRFDFNEVCCVTEFCVQPNMIFSVPEQWNDMEDYVEALKSKARIRYRRARNMIAGITSRNLSLEDIEHYQEKMFQLYKNIAQNAGFNLFILDKAYFAELKRRLGDDFVVKAYFDTENQLVGFFTVLKNYDHMDAHFLGYEIKYNKEHQLYLNMLFDMIGEGIEKKVRKIFMSRTAVEIKSSVGAQAVDTYCYLFHRNKIYNKLVPSLVKRLYKAEEWQPRSPFK